MPPIKFEFELEFLTPVFIGGSDHTKKTDFTPKPLKSALRYWWRQFQNMQDGRAPFQGESEVVGSTKYASNVSLRMPRNVINLAPHLYRPPNQSGLDYLFSTCRKRSDWIGAPSSVKLILTFRGGDEGAIRETPFALWLAAMFGGLVPRSRRGAGSSDPRLEAASGLSPEELEPYSKRALREARSDWPSGKLRLNLLSTNAVLPPHHFDQRRPRRQEG